MVDERGERVDRVRALVDQRLEVVDQCGEAVDQRSALVDRSITLVDRCGLSVDRSRAFVDHSFAMWQQARGVVVAVLSRMEQVGGLVRVITRGLCDLAGRAGGSLAMGVDVSCVHPSRRRVCVTGW
jgi:hypothetical protein